MGRALNTYSSRRDAPCRISARGERRGKPRLYGCGVSWSRRFRIAQRLIQRLVAARSLLHHVPSVVVVTESDGRSVMHSAIVERRPDLIDRRPTPDKLDVGEIASLADSGNAQQFATHDLNPDRAIVATVAGRRTRNQRPYRVYSERREQHIPTGRRFDAGGTLVLGSHDPSAAL